MRYRLEDILQYSRNVEMACGQTGIPARFPADTWEINKQRVEHRYDKFQKNPSKRYFEKYAQAVWLAAAYLKNEERKETVIDKLIDSVPSSLVENGMKQALKEEVKEVIDPNRDKIEFFNNHILVLRDGTHKLLELNIPTPKPIYDEGETRSPAANAFFASEQFEKLKQYNSKLAKGGHTNYFFGMVTLNENAADLKNMLDELEKQKSMEGIYAVLEEFYAKISPFKVDKDNVIEPLSTSALLIVILQCLGIIKTADTLIGEVFSSLDEFKTEESNVLGFSQ